MIETPNTTPYYQSPRDEYNPLLYRTVRDEPINEKRIRGIEL